MIANYHTHTWRCRHADGTEREYVETAIEAGSSRSIWGWKRNTFTRCGSL